MYGKKDAYENKLYRQKDREPISHISFLYCSLKSD